jgi:hypothetical protein
LARHLCSAVSGEHFAGHQIGEAEFDDRHQPGPRCGGGALATQVSFASLRTSFDRALRTVQEYSEKVEYIHLNPVKAGLVRRPQDWRWSSFNEYSGMSADEQNRRCGLIIDRVRMPSDPRTRI